LKLTVDHVRIAQGALEITTAQPLTEEAVRQAWPNVTYRGANIIDLIGAADNQFGRDGTGEDQEQTQEVYLGYNPGKDTFVIGFDGWGTSAEQLRAEEEMDEEAPHSVIESQADYNFTLLVEFKTADGKTLNEVEEEFSQDVMFYTPRDRSGYSLVKSRFTNIIDLRLD